MDIKKLVKPNIRTLKAYQAKEIPCRIKLDANECPYGFKGPRGVQTNRYPDPEAQSLRKLLAKGLKVRADCILHGNGSDELIYNLITTFGGPVLYPVPTFSMYGIISQSLGEKSIELPLDNEFDLATDSFLMTIKKSRPKLIFLSSPNNPTGNRFSTDRILKIIKAASSGTKGEPSLVIVDEAYQPFSGKNEFLPLLKKYKNLVVMRTLSKVGLAGLRVGFMIAHREIIDEVNKVRLPFNLNSLSQKVALEALKEKKALRKYISEIVSERKRLFREISKLDGIEPYRSDANFILFKARNSISLYKGLLKKGILIRDMNNVFKDCLRVTVGTPAENRAFLDGLRELLVTDSMKE